MIRKSSKVGVPGLSLIDRATANRGVALDALPPWD